MRSYEQAGHRPALVLSPQSYNGKTGLMLCCPITSQTKGYPFEVPVGDNPKVTGCVLADQVKSLDWWARRAVLRCQLDERVVSEVLARTRALLK